jgi:hypothetical protein
VKGERATPAQRRNIRTVIASGDHVMDSRRYRVRDPRTRTRLHETAVATIIQESGAKNLRGGDRDSVGLFQQRHNGAWPASRIPARDAAAYYRAAVTTVRHDPALLHRSRGYLADEVQRSYTWGTSRQGSDYEQWVRRHEPQRAVRQLRPPR